MQFTSEHEMFRQTIRRFVREEINPHADEWEEQGTFPAHALFKKMGDLGFPGPDVSGRVWRPWSGLLVYRDPL